jgi:hypothetical protein
MYYVFIESGCVWPEGLWRAGSKTTHTRARAFSAPQPSPANTNEDRRHVPPLSLLLVAALVNVQKE